MYLFLGVAQLAAIPSLQKKQTCRWTKGTRFSSAIKKKLNGKWATL